MVATLPCAVIPVVGEHIQQFYKGKTEATVTGDFRLKL